MIENPDAIRAILLAGTGSHELPGRAPLSAATLTTTHAAAIGA